MQTWGRLLARRAQRWGWLRTYAARSPLTVALVAWAALVALFAPPLRAPSLDLRVGQLSPVDVQAPRAIENRFRTRMLQEEAVRNALRAAAQDPSSYSIDPAAGLMAADQVRKALDLVRQAREQLWVRSGSEDEPAPPTPAAAASRVAELKEQVARQAGLSVPDDVLLRSLRLPPDAFETVAYRAPRLVEELMGSTRIGQGDVGQARAQLAQRASSLAMTDEAARVAAGMAQAALGPNLVLDQSRLERVRAEAARSVQPVMVAPHQTILRRGEQVTEEHLQLLADLGLLGRRSHPWMSVAGLAGLCGVLVGVFAVYLARFHPSVASSARLCWLLAVLALAVAVLARLLQAVVWPFAGYLVPVALAGILACVLVDARVALVLVVLLSTVVVGLAFGFEGRFMAVAALTGVVAVFAAHRVGQRSELTRAGLVAGAAGLAGVGILGLFQADGQVLMNSWAGFANGVGSSVLALGLLPFMEGLFGVASSVRLMELCNPHQPLLRRLLLEAPGTYHHSLMVGNLAEAAAEAVGADPVLCRAGALYHDVGKVRRPYLFVENQMGDQNPHDRLSPSLSTLIIMSHVKDGVELARRHRLPEAVVEFIRTHHGTDLVRYFYAKAVQQEGPDKVDERDFRYPGPKPRTKETAIVMLADSVEASARALKNPTPGRVEGLVHRTLRERLLDGQLDESPLTLQELHTIAEAFTRVLTGVYHSRVEYPARDRERDRERERERERDREREVRLRRA
ncbi:MAG TPA: HDIG domain-containing metalloprotein [Limnochordales bacterium]